MRLLEAFEREHRLIVTVAGALYRWAEEDGDPADAAAFARFLRTYSAGFHHAREEEVLFPALVDHLEVPADRGPLMVLTQEHRRLEELTARLARDADRDVAREIARLLWEHADKEDTVAFLEAGERLERAGVRELPDREPTAEELAAAELGEQLARRYTPLEDPNIVRGAGCVACSAYGETCRGIEAEWWNAWEWEHHFGLQE